MATANTKLKIDFGFDAQGSSNVTGDLKVSGNLDVTGTLLYSGAATGDWIPLNNGSQLGNTTNRWTLLANSGNFSNNLTVVGSTTLQETLAVTKTVSAGNTTIFGFANISTSVNTALFTVGSAFQANTTGVYHTGTINTASFTTTGIVANVSGVYPTSNTVGTALGTSGNR